MYGNRPQSAPLGRHQQAAPSGSNNNNSNSIGTTPQIMAMGAANRPIGRPSSAIAHLRLATALQQHGNAAGDPQQQQPQANAPSKLLRPQSAAIAGRYLPQQQLQQQPVAAPRTSVSPPRGGGGVSFYEGLVGESDSSLNMSKLQQLAGGRGNTSSGNGNTEAAAPIASEDAAAIASLKGEIMLLQRVLETVEEFDLSFPPPSPRDNIISNQSHQMMGGYQPITFNNNSSNASGNNNASSHTPTPTPSAELRAIEQQLIAIHPSALLSDKGVAEAKAALMELLIERIKAVSIAALRKVDAGAAETRVMPSRVSGFTTLIKYVMEIAERKRAWEGRVRHIHQNMSSAEQQNGGYGEENTSGLLQQQGAGGYRGMVPSPPPASGLSGGLSPARTPLAAAAASAASQQHPPVTLLDLALNEPTVSEIQSLIAEQRQLQATLKQLLEPAMGGGNHIVAGSARMSGSSGGAKQIPTPLQSSLGIAVGGNSVTPFSLGSIGGGGAAAAATKRGSLIGADPAIHETMPPTANATPRPSDIAVDPSSAGPFSPTPRTSGGGGGGGAKAPGGKRSGAGRSGSLSGSVGLSRGASAGGYGHHNAGAFDSARAQQTEAQLKQKTADLHAANDKCDELKKELAAMRRAKEEAERELSALKATEIAQFLEYESEWSIRSKVAAVAFGPIGGGNLPFAAGEGGNTNGSFGGPAAASPTSTAAPPSPASALTGISGGGFGVVTPSSQQQQQRSTSASALRKQHSVSSMNVADLLQMSSNNNNSAASATAAAHSTEPLPNRLMAFGIPPEMLVAPHVPEAESAVIVSKIQQLFIDAAAFVADSATNAKGRKTLKTLQDEAAAAQSRQQALVAGSAADRQQFLLGLVGHAGCYGGGHVTATSSFGSEGGGGGAITSRNGHRGGGANTRGGPLSTDSSAAMTPRIAGGSGGPRGGGASTFSAPSSSSPSSGGGGSGGNCADPMLSNALAAIGAPTAPAALIPLLPRSEALDGAAWAALYRQNTIIRRLCDKLDEAEAARRGVEADAEAEAARLQRIVRTLEERVSAHKATNARLSQRHEQLQYEFEERNRPQHEDEDDDENDGGTDVNNSIDGGGGPDSAATTVAGGIVKKKKKLFTTAADKVRIVQTKNQPMTAAERERELHRALLAKDKKIENITDQLRASKHDIDDKAAEIASMGRERLSLLSKCAEESLKVQTLQKQLEEAYAVKQASQDSALTMKRELREKSALEADNAQKLWKSQVELHISHNVIAELRKREQQLLDDLDDAVEQRRILRDQHLSKSTENRKMQTLFELQLQEARAAVDTAKEALYAERQQTLANEKEMERLRVVDVQLETMEQNFNNYAASMIVKREAGEEEERVLGECLEQIQQDVFSLPNEAAMGEEQLTLLLAKLSHRKEVLENESRLNRQAEKALSERKRMLTAQQSVNGGGSGGGNNGHPNLRDGPTAEDEEKAAIATAEEQLTNKKRLGLLLQRRYNDVQIFACERRLAEVRRGMQLRETMTELTSIQHIHEAMLKELSQTRSQLDAMAQRNSELEVERKQLLRDRERDEGQNKRLQAQVQRLNVTSEAQEGMLVDLGTKLQHEKILSSSPPRGANALTSRTLQQSNNGGNNNGGRGMMNASQNSQMTITSQTGPGGLAVSTFGGGELDHFGMTSNASTSGASGGIPTPTATVVGGLHNGQNGYTFTKDGKKQYNIAPLGPVL